MKPIFKTLVAVLAVIVAPFLAGWLAAGSSNAPSSQLARIQTRMERLEAEAHDLGLATGRNEAGLAETIKALGLEVEKLRQDLDYNVKTLKLHTALIKDLYEKLERKPKDSIQ